MRSISDISEGGLGSSGTDGHANPAGKIFSHRSSREGLRNPLAPSFPVRMKHVGKELTDIVRSISIGHEKIFIVDVWTADGWSFSRGCLCPRRVRDFSPAADEILPKFPAICDPGAGFNGRVNGFTRVDYARPVADW